MSNRKSVKLVISGRVQGVFYRVSARDKALSLGLSGYVKNLRNGGVESRAEGFEIDLERYIDWCKKGPKSAKVESIKIEWDEFKGEFNNFSITG